VLPSDGGDWGGDGGRGPPGEHVKILWAVLTKVGALFGIMAPRSPAVSAASRAERSGSSWRQVSVASRVESGADREKVQPSAIYVWTISSGTFQVFGPIWPRGELRTQLKIALRQGRTRRANRSRVTSTRGKIPDMVNISDRPKEADDRAVSGFWEGDLIIGKGNKSQIAIRLSSVPRKKMETLPEFMRKSMTWDQGKEMARHTDFTIKTGMPIYFCGPHSPWQRGSNENTNGLLEWSLKVGPWN
jgi:IS30 family transposase